MIEKLSEYKISRDGAFLDIDCNAKIINTLVRKINELVDWINDVSALRVTDNQVTANLPNIDAGELAFLSKENSDLKDELDRTRKALDVAKDTFNWIDETYRTGQEVEAEIWGKVQLAAQEITALEQKE